MPTWSITTSSPRKRSAQLRLLVDVAVFHRQSGRNQQMLLLLSVRDGAVTRWPSRISLATKSRAPGIRCRRGLDGQERMGRRFGSGRVSLPRRTFSSSTDTPLAASRNDFMFVTAVRPTPTISSLARVRLRRRAALLNGLDAPPLPSGESRIRRPCRPLLASTRSRRSSPRRRSTR